MRRRRNREEEAYFRALQKRLWGSLLSRLCWRSSASRGTWSSSSGSACRRLFPASSLLRLMLFSNLSEAHGQREEHLHSRAQCTPSCTTDLELIMLHDILFIYG